jgi:4-carboxymuconolactone decarboxylase
VPPLPSDHLDPEIESLLTENRPPGVNLIMTLARHPQLLKPWLIFSEALAKESMLEPRDRELAILRTAWLCGSRYTWRHHVESASKVGLRREEIERVKIGAEAAWSRREATILRAADELHGTLAVSDRTWSSLRKEFEDPQLIELIMLAGQYTLIALLVRALGVEVETSEQ